MGMAGPGGMDLCTRRFFATPDHAALMRLPLMRLLDAMPLNPAPLFASGIIGASRAPSPRSGEIIAMPLTMPLALRKFALTMHLATSVGLLGAIAAFLALAVAGLASADAPMIRAAYPAMELTARRVIVPLAVSYTHLTLPTIYSV